MYCRKLRVRSSGVFGRLMNLGGSLARHSGSPLLKTLSMTFSTLSGLSDMMNVAKRPFLPRTRRHYWRDHPGPVCRAKDCT